MEIEHESSRQIQTAITFDWGIWLSQFYIETPEKEQRKL